MKLMFDVLMLLLFAELALAIRMFWYGGLALKYEWQAEQREHELNVLKLQIELAKASTNDTPEDLPCASADS